MKIRTIGVMTGNSLDAADVVLTAFDDNDIKDEAFYTLPYPAELKENFLHLKEEAKNCSSTAELSANPLFLSTTEAYSRLVAEAVNKLLAKSGADKAEIAAVGLCGQTCDHCPPSVAGNAAPYTLQVGNAQLVADLTGLPVIYDFRSDDLMNGGEGAPLAPMHHLHIARTLAARGIGPVAFCNGGNTGNITLITYARNGQTPELVGWDVGPFNHLPDLLMREYLREPYDKNGKAGSKGQVQPELLQKFFHQAALTADGRNFYNEQPPKSADPRWYRVETDGRFTFADNLRTVEYLSAYSYVYNLRYVHPQLVLPSLYLLFGGGWKNPLVKEDFEKLMHRQGVILPEHRGVFESIFARLPEDPQIAFANEYGFSGEYMEARIFADAARMKILNQPFTRPETTGCRTPTVCGVYVLPSAGGEYLLTRLLKENNNPAAPVTSPLIWSRAARGWQSK